jgi:exodeoxyribonuclease VII large subunit
VDVTVADLVADARASTPTKAGVVAVPDRVDVLADLANQEQRLAGTMRSHLDLCAQYVQTILASAVFRNPTLAIRNRQQHVDELADNLAEALRLLLAEARRLLQDYYEQVAQIEPHRLLGRMSVELNDWKARHEAAVTNVLSRSRLQLTAQENRLVALDPRSVLKRGYSITMNKQSGRVVRTPDDVQIGESLLTELADGNRIDSQVTGKDHSTE